MRVDASRHVDGARRLFWTLAGPLGERRLTGHKSRRALQYYDNI